MRLQDDYGAGEHAMNVAFPSPVKVGSDTAVSKLDAWRYIHFVWRHWKFIGTIAALAFLLAVIYLARATPLYTATTQILLDPRREKGIGAEAALSDIQLMDIS